MRFDPQKIEHVIWMQTSFLGDIILSTAAFNLLKESYPAIRQHLITTETGKAALSGHQALESITVFDKKSGSSIGNFFSTRNKIKRLLEKVKRGNVVVLQPHKSFRSSILTRLLSLPVITYYETSLSFLSTQRVSRVSLLHEAARIGLLLEPVGINREQIVSAKPVLPISEPPTQSGGWSEAILESKKSGQLLIGVAPGSQWATKMWPIVHFISLIDLILKHRQDLQIVLLGNREEMPLCDEILLKSNQRNRIISTCGKTSFDNLRWIYPQLSVLVSNDSSPVHYASAFNIPTVAIFGPTVPAMGFGPLADKSKVVQHNISCQPCSDHGPMKCPLVHFRCMKDIGAEKVFETLLAIPGIMPNY